MGSHLALIPVKDVLLVPSQIQIVQVYMNGLTGICNRIETDTNISGADRHTYLEAACSVGISHGTERQFYNLHALFVKTPSDYWLELVPVWDISQGWYPKADHYFS